jgi:hypothetical protein
MYRFNLEEGRFMTPIRIAQGWGDGRESEVEGVNVVDVNPRHGLWSLGLDGGGGVVEFWDPRSRSALTRLVLPSSELLPIASIDPDSLLAPPIQKLSITSLKSHPTDGLSLAIGTSSGHALLYDLRSPTPFAIKDQGYGEPVKSVDWLRGGGAQEDTGRVISADSKVIKIWGKDDVSQNGSSWRDEANQINSHQQITYHYTHQILLPTFTRFLTLVSYSWPPKLPSCAPTTFQRLDLLPNGLDSSTTSRRRWQMTKVQLERVHTAITSLWTERSWIREWRVPLSGPRPHNALSIPR